MSTTPKAPPKSIDDSWQKFPWWLVAIVGFLLLMGYLIVVNENYNEAFMFIKGSPGTWEDLVDRDFAAFIGKGVSVTVFTTLIAFGFALILGLMAGLGRISKNIVLRNVATTYVEFIRGVPTLVLIFTVAFVLVPLIGDLLIGDVVLEEGTAVSTNLRTNVAMFGEGIKAVSMNTRAIVALALIYGAFLAEVFRAGIESITKGQMEAARSLGMTQSQAMRKIILPQAVRNILPALGNDFIAMLKDSSLVSVLAVRDITQQGRLYAGSSFRFRESYLVLTFLYLSMTLTLSLILRLIEKRMGKNV